MAGHVFISYSNRDRRYVESLSTFLTEHGVTVWYDHALRPGAPWGHVIEAQLTTSNAVVVVVTPDSSASEWVRNEVEWARSHRKPLLPLLLAGKVPLSLAGRQFEDVTGGHMPGPAFVEELRGLVSGASQLPAVLRDAAVPVARSVGLHLGTKHAVLGVFDAGRAVTVANAHGSPTTPATVAFDRRGDAVVGEDARPVAVIDPVRGAHSVVRELGSDWALDVDGHAYAAHELVALLLMRVKSDAEANQGAAISEIVLAVPTCFDSAKRRAAARAAQSAHLTVVRLVGATAAAAVAYMLRERPAASRALILSLDSASFDAGIATIAGDRVEVVAVCGDDQFGADDWDQRIVDHLARTIVATYGVDVTSHATAMARLHLAAEGVRAELAVETSTKVVLPFLVMGSSGPVHVDLGLSRAEFENLTLEPLERCRGIIERVLAAGGPHDIDQVVLAGEAGIPALVALATSLSGATADPVLGADAIAVGATRLAAELSGEARGVRLRDVAPWATVGETDDGVRLPIIAANTALPAEGSVVVTTVADNQPSLRIKLLQTRDDGDARPVGTFVVEPLPAAPRGVPQIEVTVGIDDGGFVRVRARDQHGGDGVPVAGAE